MARLERRFSHCVVASEVWVCVDGCSNSVLGFCFLFGRRGEARLERGFSHCVVASEVWGCVGGC